MKFCLTRNIGPSSHSRATVPAILVPIVPERVLALHHWNDKSQCKLSKEEDSIRQTSIPLYGWTAAEYRPINLRRHALRPIHSLALEWSTLEQQFINADPRLSKQLDKAFNSCRSM